MSQQPVWLTDEGSLGTVPEGEFYSLSLVAFDPEDPLDPTLITYTLLAGKLPAGVAVRRNGKLEGIPISIADVKGVPSIVSENTTSKFTIRATSDQLRINDRTFTLTVTGQDAPEFITPPGLIGGYFDGDQIDLKIEIEDKDPADVLTMKLISGELPPGTILTESGDDIGSISGYIKPIPDENTAFAGFDKDGGDWDEFPFDFGSRSIDKNYQFTLQLTDRKDIALRTFEIFVYSRDGITADSTAHTVDSLFITVDSVSIRQPFLLNYIPEFGQVRHDNFFAFQYKGLDPNGGELKFNHVSGTLPAELLLDEDTGWLSGYLTNVNINEIKYEFGIQLAIANEPNVVSVVYPFEFTVIGEIETNIVWITQEELGTIYNGEISTFYVQAIHQDTVLLYRLKSGLYNKLPQGLTLLSSGNIAGRASFKTFSLDNNSTTFDAEFETRLELLDETTFDRTFVFYVEAYSTDGFVGVTKKFIIRLDKDTNLPYTTLYAKAMPPDNDREIIRTLLADKSIMIPSILYRTDDPNFGVAQHVTYGHAYGLAPASIEEYFESFELNHYRKTVTLGEIKTARALDENGRVLYEVVYSHIIDDMVNQRGESVSGKVNLSAGAINHGEGGALDTVINEVFPNSFINMRDQVVDQIGQISKVLPRWMLSKQEDGRILGFTTAWVIAYTNPGQSNLLSYRIETQFKEQLNKVDFTLDRFTLDSRLTKDWELCGSYINTVTADNNIITTDITEHTADEGPDMCDDIIDNITADTTQHTTDETALTADRVGGYCEECEIGWEDGIMTTFDRIAPLNDVTADNTFVTADSDRFVYSEFQPDTSIPIDNDFNIDSETIFDGGSCRFMSPLDEYNASDKYDRYIMYPQVDITNTIPIKVGETV